GDPDRQAAVPPPLPREPRPHQGALAALRPGAVVPPPLVVRLRAGLAPTSAFRYSLSSAMNILVKGNNWLGDAVMSLPTLRSLKEMEPRRRVTVLPKPAVADLSRGAPFVDEVLAHQRGGMTTWVRTVRDLKRRKFDAALLLPRSFSAAFLAWSVRAR